MSAERLICTRHYLSKSSYLDFIPFYFPGPFYFVTFLLVGSLVQVTIAAGLHAYDTFQEIPAWIILQKKRIFLMVNMDAMK